MSIDRQAVVWTQLGTQPLRMGQLYLTERECRFTYDPDYLATGLPGVGAIYTPEVYASDTIVRTRTDAFDFLPPIQSLIPPHGERNFQRRLVLEYLARNGMSPASGLEADWEILRLSGHGGIGHLDVFESDEKAADWYATPARPVLYDVTQESDFSLKDYLTWFDQDAEALMQVIGPTPSVGGAIPKLLVSIPASGWDGRIGLPARFGAQGLIDVVLKFEQPTVYPGLVELEALALDVHREAGFSVPRHWVVEFNGVPALAVERFDRDRHKNPLFTESLYSVLASGDARITHNHSYSYDEVGRAIDRSPIDFVTDRDAAKRHLMARLLMALLTGNGDLHLENLSIVGIAGELEFSPVYDPTPMRAYSIHNMLSVMPFGGYGEMDDATGSAVGLMAALRNLAKNLGVSPAILEEITGKALQATEQYSERLRALASLPEANRENLVAIVERVRGQFSG
ncbi:MAG: HipA domain-containing protein [Pseudomonadota bacterium]